MPQIIVVADGCAERTEPAVMFTERVSVSDFESRHFQTQLVERLGWAVGDADAAERSQPQDDPGEDWAPAPPSPAREPEAAGEDQRPSARVVTTAS